MKQILFVDDESQVLDGLKNLLHRYRNQWEMHFALGGKEALAAMDQRTFDVLVSDMRMPEIDGVYLLKYAQEKYPHIVRIILSGYSELESALRTVMVAHQFLTKPCDPIVLQQTIERACNLQALIQDQNIKQLIGKIDKLPALPRVYHELTQVLANPNAQAKDVAKVLEQDMAMCAKLLQLANSSFFRVGKPLTTIELAVVHLGFSMVKNLTLSVEVFRSKEKLPVIPHFSFETMQQHSLLAAAIATRLLKDKAATQDAFMASILHDIGKMVLAMALPEQFTAAMNLAQQEHLLTHDAERQVLGVSHAEVGGYLLGIWGLPYSIIEAVANHHTPSHVESSRFDVLSATYVADSLAHENMASGVNRFTQSGLDLGYLEKMQVKDKLEGWRTMAKEQALNMGTIH